MYSALYLLHECGKAADTICTGDGWKGMKLAGEEVKGLTQIPHPGHLLGLFLPERRFSSYLEITTRFTGEGVLGRPDDAGRGLRQACSSCATRQHQ